MMVTSIEPTGAIRPRTDAELIGDICAERTGALEKLFHRYVRLVTGIAHRILNDRAEAEDVTQEVFLEIYRKAHLYTPSRGSFRVWLLQYVYHRTLRRKAVLQRRAAYRGEPIETVDERTPARRQRLTQDECRWILHTALAQLPERQRTTLELTCFEDLPLRDVAARLGVSVGCTRHDYYRGLARLKQWARLTDRLTASECRAASRAGTTDDATGPDRPPYVHI
ncbi:MAG TPA: sigma-70 family RNA polymerase sigma factor [Vicinamibacterales bacterium]|nr:sigma-70 family RNA polymerase sigma factor [Vicinamibacterales bacterium]